LYIETHVREHPFFTREGKDIYCEVPITFIQAALGDEIAIPTLDGKTKIKVPAGTQSGQVLRIKDKGVQNLNGRGKGDLFIKIHVEIPVNLNSKQRELLEEFGKTYEQGHSPKAGKFFEKLQELLS
jgi:molecular chaperone DnaJ